MKQGKQHQADKITRAAHAKLNLFLHVVGRRDDGYHELESLFAFTKGGDLLSAELSDDLTLQVDGPFSASLNASGAATDNLVLRAAHSLKQHARYNGGAAIRLTKNLPVASGIGGGSADAAAALLILNQLWALDMPHKELEGIALTLGADVPACLHTAPLMVGGIGENLTETSLPKGYGILLVNSGEGVSTPAAFQKYHEERVAYRAPLRTKAPSGSSNFISWIVENTGNDLTKPALDLCETIADVLNALETSEGALLTRMSGSGATCFALFEGVAEAKQAQKTLAQEHPGWWMFADQLMPG